MKIKEITDASEVVTSWQKKDADYNPEAFEYAQKQEKRTSTLRKRSKGTPVFTKPVGKKQEPFTTKPKSEGPKSPGYRGNIDTKVKSGHISKEDGDKLVS